MAEDLQRPQASGRSKHAEGVRVQTGGAQKQMEQTAAPGRLTSECFFLEDKSRVVSYKLSTKFLRHGTFTSFFTAYGTEDTIRDRTPKHGPLQTPSYFIYKHSIL